MECWNVEEIEDLHKQLNDLEKISSATREEIRAAASRLQVERGRNRILEEQAYGYLQRAGTAGFCSRGTYEPVFGTKTKGWGNCSDPNVRNSVNQLHQYG